MPGLRFGMSYRPVLVLTAVRVVPVATFAADTVRPGMAAPVSSVMLPEIDPFEDCAIAVRGTRARQRRISARKRIFFALFMRGLLARVLVGLPIEPLGVTDDNTAR